MLHKISDLCDRIDAIKFQADRLREAKYGPNKRDSAEVQALIDDIQAMCYTVANDKSKYQKVSYLEGGQFQE
jgi:hypothetical protein